MAQSELRYLQTVDKLLTVIDERAYRIELMWNRLCPVSPSSPEFNFSSNTNSHLF